jgi:integrase
MKTLHKALDRYLAFRGSLGFKLRDHASALPRFIAFLDSKGAEFVTTELALDWAQEPRQATQAHHAKRLCMVRGFARYLQASDPRTQVPPQGVLPGRPQRAQPYIYTDEEILDLIREASRLQPSGALRPHTYSTVFGLLAVTGMRVSEIAALDRADVDLEQGVLTVRRSKFNRTRLLPLHSSTQRELQAYARRRDRLIPVRLSDGFFISDRGARLNPWMVRYTFARLSCAIGLRKATDRHGPRLHDLRHTFAVKTLTNWYRDGINPEQRLPLLSAYLGHVKVSDTYWYLSAVPELLGALSARLETFLGDRS